MMNNPCKKCEFAESFQKGKTGKQHYYVCRHENGICEKYKRYLISHVDYLESRRMFSPSNIPIENIDELLSQEWVWIFGRPKHIQFVKQLSLSMLLQLIKHKSIKKVIKRK